LSSQLGLRGVQDDWDTDGAVGHGEGDDWEDEVNAELLAEQGDAMQTDGMHVKAEARSPEPALFTMKERRVRVVRRLVERPKTVYERFPAFEKDSVLAFTELFKGKVPRKSRISKRPFHGMCWQRCQRLYTALMISVVETWYPRRRDVPRNFLDSVVGDTQRQQQSKAAADVVASSNIEDDLSKTLNASPTQRL
jgi:hypothetical protein